MISYSNDGIFNMKDAVSFLKEIFNTDNCIGYVEIFFTDLGNDFLRIKMSELEVEEFSNNINLDSFTPLEINEMFIDFLKNKKEQSFLPLNEFKVNHFGAYSC